MTSRRKVLAPYGEEEEGIGKGVIKEGGKSPLEKKKYKPHLHYQGKGLSGVGESGIRF